uniref:Uncharacterized protein n=1 Tax=Arundo donax TaxID=35708 RepID=A0A0A9TJM6_ARUDO
MNHVLVQVALQPSAAPICCFPASPIQGPSWLESERLASPLSATRLGLNP